MHVSTSHLSYLHSPNISQCMGTFKVQFNDYDTYQSLPLDIDCLHGQVHVVPIIRIYGSFSVSSAEPQSSAATSSSTSASATILDGSALSFTTVLHVHNFFPYFYIDAPVHSVPLQTIISYLESCIRDSFLRNPGDEDEDEYGSNDDLVESDCGQKRRFIARISLCKGTPVYGYQVGNKCLLKVSLLSPNYKTRLVRLIHDKKINFANFCSTKEKYKPNVYETHLPMLLQFLTDFNLYGCGWVELDSFWFRSPVLDYNSSALRYISTTNIAQLNHSLRKYLTQKSVLNPRHYPRIANTVLELDAITASISNRNTLHARHLHHDFVERYNFDPHLAQTPTYLTSTLHIVKDLKYQCEVRGRQPVSSQNIGNNLGFTSTEWANSTHLRKSLDYVITLNGAYETDYESYARARIKDEHPELPSSFALVDIEKTYAPKPKLLRWSDFDSLFSEKQEPFQSQLSQLSQANEPNEPSQPKKILSSFDSLSDALSSSKEVLDLPWDSENEAEERSEQNDPLAIGSETKQHSQIINDETILQMTQRHALKRPLEEPPLSPVLQVHSSFSELELQNETQIELASCNGCCYELKQPASIQKESFKNGLDSEGILQVDYVDPFYSKSLDGAAKPLVFANKKIVVPCLNDTTIPPFSFLLTFLSPSFSVKSMLKSAPGGMSSSKKYSWEYVVAPPPAASIKDWLAAEKRNRSTYTQIEHPNSGTGAKFKYSYRLELSSRRPDSFIRLTNFHAEIHVNTDFESLPDPESDQVSAVFYHFDDANLMFDRIPVTGVLVNRQTCDNVHLLKSAVDMKIDIYENEKSMVDQLLFLVEAFDPDILCGYEINALSWGYLVERFRAAYDINLLPLLSRCTFKSNGKFGDRWGYTHTSALKINGRHLLNVWRVFRSNVTLTSYSLENVVFHILHQTIAKCSNNSLSKWFRGANASKLLFVLNYYMQRILLVQKMLDVREIITKNVEEARFIGVDFYSVFFRGSQYKVESILSRISKVESLLLNSPSKTQVSNMKPLEAISLILEPDSNFYKSPLVVLDFQSLYPSIMIAYNYCFTTLLGRLDGFDPKKNTIGFLKHLHLPPGLVNLLKQNDDINLSPNGYMFAKSSVRKSLLSKMLEEILNTRIQVKTVMLMFKDDTNLAKLLNSRQLALKLIANVTYGYASASFSGRMPNSAIADAIVSTGREILTKSINIIELANYGAKVVYGDTDSLFMYLPGRSKEDAFRIGREVAAHITSLFPDPIQLKFEKVYHPCVLLSKKRYVGNCFEYESQQEATFQAKGIETVRRDGIPAQLKMVEKALRILFTTKDLSLVKDYTLTQFRKIIANRISIRDFCFAKEVRFGTYKNLSHIPAGAMVAMRKVARDPRSEPQYRERVPYVVIEDAEKPRIRDRSVPPEEFIEAYRHLRPVRLDYEYYIGRVLIPPLERIFNLVGADVRGWYKELPKHTVTDVHTGVLKMSRHIKSKTCINCGGEVAEDESTSVCRECLSNEQALMVNAVMSSRSRERHLTEIAKTCYRCISSSYASGSSIRGMETACENQSCDVYYERIRSIVFKAQLDRKHKLVEEAVEW